MRELVKHTGVLDLNSVYSYLMLCSYFPDTCVIAEHERRIAGFVTGFCPPIPLHTVFVWQIAVDAAYRGQGLGISLLKELLDRDACAQVNFLETTITPSNGPSHALFSRLARDMGVHCVVSSCFPESVFPQKNHEEERLYRIGPFNDLQKELK